MEVKSFGQIPYQLGWLSARIETGNLPRSHRLNDLKLWKASQYTHSLPSDSESRNLDYVYLVGISEADTAAGKF